MTCTATVYYFGRNPALNAASNAITHAPNLVRNHICGGTVGHPIIKNKLFPLLRLRALEPAGAQKPRHDDADRLEREGDFSQSLNASGGLRTIYDPFSTRLDSDRRVTRDPFPGNIIPMSRQDPTSRKFIKEIWDANRPGDDITGVNNFRADFARANTYHNISYPDRLSDQREVEGVRALQPLPHRPH